MINNKLKPCCEECGHLNLQTAQDAERNFSNDGTFRTVLRSDIWCDHMYVCKRYIEYKDTTEE